MEAVKDKEYFEKSIKKIMQTREKVSSELKEMDFKVLDSKANFLFISHNKVSGEELYIRLKDKGILVRYFKKDLIDNYLRVTIGTEEEMEKFLEKLKEILAHVN